jgi:hypothetical protein
MLLEGEFMPKLSKSESSGRDMANIKFLTQSIPPPKKKSLDPPPSPFLSPVDKKVFLCVHAFKVVYSFLVQKQIKFDPNAKSIPLFFIKSFEVIISATEAV